MRIGILSDTHGSLDATADAVRLLQDRGAEHLLHCGDVGSPMVLDHLAGMPAGFVWATATTTGGPRAHAGILGIRCYGPVGDVRLDSRRIALLHGDDLKMRQSLLAGQQYDYLLQGHTHRSEDVRVGRTRVINPGACTGRPRGRWRCSTPRPTRWSSSRWMSARKQEKRDPGRSRFVRLVAFGVYWMAAVPEAGSAGAGVSGALSAGARAGAGPCSASGRWGWGRSAPC